MTAIVGGQPQVTHTGTQFQQKISETRSQNQFWDVPSGTWFEGQIFGSNTSTRVEIDGSPYIDVPESSAFIGDGQVKLGGGCRVYCRTSGTIYIRGILFNNGTTV